MISEAETKIIMTEATPIKTGPISSTTGSQRHEHPSRIKDANTAGPVIIMKSTIDCFYSPYRKGSDRRANRVEVIRLNSSERA